MKNLFLSTCLFGFIYILAMEGSSAYANKMYELQKGQQVVITSCDIDGNAIDQLTLEYLNK